MLDVVVVVVAVTAAAVAVAVVVAVVVVVANAVAVAVAAATMVVVVVAVAAVTAVLVASPTTLIGVSARIGFESSPWTHLGAVCTGIAYGYLTCPTLQLDNASSKTGQEDGVAVVRRYADPCKSVIAFAVFIAILSSLLLFVESQELNFL
ncbi:hypothetical protein GIB67_016697 [Kingdonia uniflora]|uniref:Uncharacterized protein n=1 Tax=Kingdonia uniflora TaxID=39325 RepID=A0A7J7LM99_9MAGN|nr:hypothetical protein GIB67_016697 [Kingdonia uniflora]